MVEWKLVINSFLYYCPVILMEYLSIALVHLSEQVRNKPEVVNQNAKMDQMKYFGGLRR